jgi:type IV pilus assembly protein PilM
MKGPMLMIEQMEDVNQAALYCPECEVANLPQRKFCAKCGTSLWKTCPQCGDASAAGEAFCGTCGTNLVEAGAERVERMESVFQTAAELRAERRLYDAIALLLPIKKIQQPHMAGYVSRASELVREMSAECSQQRVLADEECRRASQLFDAFDFDGAAKILEMIPATFRNDAILKLGAQVEAKRQQIVAIAKELHAAVREKRILDLPAQIERLLTLKPDHVYGKRLADQVQSHLVHTAKKQLADRNYEQALRLLEQIPSGRRDSQTGELYHQVAELAWLSWDLRNAPLIDRTLVAVAERLRKLAPDDARVTKPCAELQRRARLAERQPSGEPLPWARPPEQTVLDAPVDSPSGFRRLRCAAEMDQSDLRQGFGRFAVACGLALAGIHQASIEINLLQAQNRGLLSKVTRLIQPRNTKKAWGLDIGTSGLKAVKLAWDDVNQQAIVENVTLIEHAKLLIYAANDAERKKLITETLQAFLGRQQLRSERVCVGLPGRMALSYQTGSLPGDSASAAKAIEFEAGTRFPFPLTELDWDFHFFDSDRSGSDDGTKSSEKRGRNAVLLAARQATTDDFLDPLFELGVRVDVLQTDSLALHNFVLYEHFSNAEHERTAESYPVVAAMDIGAEMTNIVVSSPYSLWFHSCGVAGHSFTRALVKEFCMSLAQAEQTKRAPETAKRFSGVCETLLPVFEDLSEEMQRSLVAFAETQPDHHVQQVLTVGGGAMLHGLLRYLRCGR